MDRRPCFQGAGTSAKSSKPFAAVVSVYFCLLKRSNPEVADIREFGFSGTDPRSEKGTSCLLNPTSQNPRFPAPRHSPASTAVTTFLDCSCLHRPRPRLPRLARWHHQTTHSQTSVKRWVGHTFRATLKNSWFCAYCFYLYIVTCFLSN